MNDKASHARQWPKKAEGNLMAARLLLAGNGQLAFADAPIPSTHNLEDLQAQCVASAPTVIASGLDALDLSDLTPRPDAPQS
jgi:hypothetical protein